MGDVADALQHRGIAIAEVIQNEELLPRLRQCNAGMRANIARASRDEDHPITLNLSKPNDGVAFDNVILMVALL